MANDLVVNLGARLDQFQSDMSQAGDIADSAVGRIENSFSKLNPGINVAGLLHPRHGDKVAQQLVATMQKLNLVAAGQGVGKVAACPRVRIGTLLYRHQGIQIVNAQGLQAHLGGQCAGMVIGLCAHGCCSGCSGCSGLAGRAAAADKAARSASRSAVVLATLSRT